MCSGSDKSKSNSGSDRTAMKDLDRRVSDEAADPLELAANNDVQAFKRFVESDASAADGAGVWFVRNADSRLITQESRTPLMVAASYGSTDVVKFLVALPEVDLNRACGLDKWTPLHCAASGGSVRALDVVKILLSAGSNPSACDALGRRPADTIVAPPKLPGARAALEDLLAVNASSDASAFSTSASSSSPDARSPCSLSDFPSVHKLVNGGGSSAAASEKKQYPVDPSFPDIRNSAYSGDEFRMYSFKVKPCSRAYSHDWTECPFAHPGENARRRDPRKYHYSCVPCPDFRKGACRRGDMCEYAHGVFESWLHPAQYRTRLCKDGTSCARQVCFFAHTPEELRPLYVSTGSGVPSPRSVGSSSSYMDMAAALSLLPGSPTSNGGMTTAAWPQPNVPTLHLPGGGLQSSRLRSSLSARDMAPDDLHVLPGDYAMGFGRPKTSLAPSNLEDLFCSEMTASPPRFSDGFSPSHKSTAGFNPFHPQQHQQQSLLSPINTSTVFSPRSSAEHSLLLASLGVASPRMSPRSSEPSSPIMNPHHLAALAQRERQQMRSLSSRDLGSGFVGPSAAAAIGSSPTSSAWSNWGSRNGKHDWEEEEEEEAGSEGGEEEEPDVSWVQSLVKESSPPEMTDKNAAAVSTSGERSNQIVDSNSIEHSVLGDWLEKMQLDHLTA
ncbi:hypothetical protein M569_11102 [Genlisea aurea]|uniref:C3H1-type domain-containing protein n=1 Tax=Genlisea aurea TaxID=192259 RepID=S8DLD3_9LAMI|nr:hypothetical protein M569_11102 [Genlisea aurea]